jgi:uncharacterized membrane protein YbaN (DUF454 family)
MTNKRSSVKKFLWRALAYITFVLGLIGAFLPILPTTPFLLITVWAGSHASSKFKWWLLRHERFGQALRDWYRHKAISRTAKLTALVLISISWLVIILNGSPVAVIAFTGLLFVGCLGFLLTRPEPG